MTTTRHAFETDRSTVQSRRHLKWSPAERRKYYSRLAYVSISGGGSQAPRTTNVKVLQKKERQIDDI